MSSILLGCFSRNSSQAITKTDPSKQSASLKIGTGYNRIIPSKGNTQLSVHKSNITLPSSSGSPQVSRWVPDEKYRAQVYSHYQEHGKEAWQTIEQLDRSLNTNQSERCINEILNQLDSFHSGCSVEKSGEIYPNSVTINDLSIQNLDFDCLKDDEKTLKQLSIKIQNSSQTIKNESLRILKYIQRESQEDRCSIGDIKSAISNLLSKLQPFFRKAKYQPVESDLIKFQEALENPRKDKKEFFSELSRFCKIFIRSLQE